MKRVLVVLLTAFLFAQTASSFLVKAGISADGTDKAAGYLENVKYSSASDLETISIQLDKNADYNAMRLADPDRIVVDVFNTVLAGKAGSVKTTGTLVRNIRYAQFDTHTVRIVLDVEGQPGYTVNSTSEGLEILIGDVQKSLDGKASKSGSSMSDQVGEDKTADNRDRASEQKISVHKYFNIAYAPAAGSDEVTISLANYRGYKVTRLTGPDRLLIDIPRAKYKGKSRSVNIGSTFIRTMSYTIHGKNTARIELGMTGQDQYTVREARGELIISVSKAPYRNIRYHNNGDRVYFSLMETKLTEGRERLEKFYTGHYDKTGKTYTITCQSTLADIGAGVFHINDSRIKEVCISRNKKTGQTSIMIKAVKKFVYEVVTRDKANGTAITVLEPAKKTEKLVVIDAGHGGSATGAVYKGLYEKKFNLDIAKRLNTLLKRKKIKTYMIREDDSYVGNFERSYIANALNASLFLSIHNNAMDDTEYSGTMTLYCPQPSNVPGFDGRNFAEIIQQKLLRRLGTVNRKTIGRPNLVVLHATVMPSAVAEVAFLTNSGDRSSLQKESFRQNAAQGLCDAVVKALSKIEK